MDTADNIVYSLLNDLTLESRGIDQILDDSDYTMSEDFLSGILLCAEFAGLVFLATENNVLRVSLTPRGESLL